MIFTEEERTQLRALADRIVPADQDPSASELGALDFIERLLATDATADLPRYREGLESLTQSGFAAKNAAEQDDYLTEVERGTHGPELRAFFELAVTHVIEGTYADPGNGGNRDGRAWQMIGFEVTA